MERLNDATWPADELQDNVRAVVRDLHVRPGAQTFLIVAAPPPGFMNTHPVAIQARTEPNATLPTNVDATLAAQNLGLLEVRSVYDTDGLGRMGERHAGRGRRCRPAAPSQIPKPRRSIRPTRAPRSPTWCG